MNDFDSEFRRTKRLVNIVFVAVLVLFVLGLGVYAFLGVKAYRFAASCDKPSLVVSGSGDNNKAYSLSCKDK